MIAKIYRFIVPMKLRIKINQFRTGGSKKKCIYNLRRMLNRGECLNVLEETNYMLTRGKCETFPYEWTEEYSNYKKEIVSYDKQKKMYYVDCDGKKMYFPRTYKKDDVARYFCSMKLEQDRRSPHNYFNLDTENLEDKTFVDVGAAEGFISLLVVDKVKKIILLERSEEWKKALAATFEPYKEKVVIISKYAGERNEGEIIRIDSISELNDSKEIAVKMDVEGMEMDVLKGTEKLFPEQVESLFVCTYHKHNDEKVIKDYLESQSFSVSFSNGYMCMCNKGIPDFRRGVLRARKQNV